MKEDTVSVNTNAGTAAINFAVPSMSMLQQFQINEFDIPKELGKRALISITQKIFKSVQVSS